MADVNLGQLLSTTLKNYRKTLVDNIHNSSALFYTLKDKGKIRELDGGERIVTPLMYGRNTTAGSYSGYDQLDTTPQEGIDAAEYNWKQYSSVIAISGEQKRKNSGKSQIINLLNAKTKQAEMSLVEELTEGIFSNGTGNGNKDLTGLVAMVAASGVYGGIDSSTHTWWQANVDSTSEALSLADMRTIFNSSSVGGKDTPDLIVTTQTLYEKYESFLTQIGTTNVYGSFSTPSQGTKKLGDAGFQALEFKGVPIIWDENATSGAMYFLNTRHMDLTVHKDANFDVSEFTSPEDQDAFLAKILFMGNLTCDRRSSFGLLSNKTA